MHHVVFVHGISNKPPKNELLGIWKNALKTGGGIDLDSAGISSSMVYWADCLYPEPLGVHLGAHESAILESREDTRSWQEELSLEENWFFSSLETKFRAIDSNFDETLNERIPLPSKFKRRLMEEYLRDVHHYLWNVRFSPSSQPPVRIRETIRGRFVHELESARSRNRDLILVSHSMGTVIAYDCLKNVDSCPEISSLLTIGSPLGIDEVQDRLQPGWTRRNGYPSEKVAQEWVNIYDRFDPVCGFDPILANDFKDRSFEVVQDINVKNRGTWRHDISEYLESPLLRTVLKDWLS